MKRSSVLLLLLLPLLCLVCFRGILDSVEASLLHHDDYRVSAIRPPVALYHHHHSNRDGDDESDNDGDNDDDNEGCFIPSLPSRDFRQENLH